MSDGKGIRNPWRPGSRCTIVHLDPARWAVSHSTGLPTPIPGTTQSLLLAPPRPSTLPPTQTLILPTPRSGQDVAEIVNTGTSTRCLNLASYNYLGFAASDPYCTPQVVDTIGQLGVSGCSPRVLGGTTVAHTELEDLVAQ